ncbi:hypothetical protein BH20ACT15_BH20ACT15_12800 [soil metagenome]
MTTAQGIAALPWRGRDEARPALAVPPERMPLRMGGSWRKRWRYVGAFDERFMLCAAAAEIGPGRETFWALWDREERALRERTRHVVPLPFRPEVRFGECTVSVRSREFEIQLELGAGEEVECACPTERGAYTWTRKLAGIEARGTIRIDGREAKLAGRAVEDRSAGYHARRTSWLWSAGVGESADGRPLAWNLVSGINDPPSSSERAIWVDGAPHEPGPVTFDGLDAIRFDDGSALSFEPEAARARTEGFPLVYRSDYEAPFGSFAGSLGGIELARGTGVMERHDALW